MVITFYQNACKNVRSRSGLLRSNFIGRHSTPPVTSSPHPSSLFINLPNVPTYPGLPSRFFVSMPISASSSTTHHPYAIKSFASRCQNLRSCGHPPAMKSGADCNGTSPPGVKRPCLATSSATPSSTTTAALVPNLANYYLTVSLGWITSWACVLCRPGCGKRLAKHIAPRQTRS